VLGGEPDRRADDRHQGALLVFPAQDQQPCRHDGKDHPRQGKRPQRPGRVMPHVARWPQQEQVPQMFDGAARRIKNTDDAALLRPAEAPDELEGHERQETIPGLDADPQPPRGRDESGHHAHCDQAHQEPVEQPRGPIPDLTHRPAAGAAGLLSCGIAIVVWPFTAVRVSRLHDLAWSARHAGGTGMHVRDSIHALQCPDNGKTSARSTSEACGHLPRRRCRADGRCGPYTPARSVPQGHRV
jgi:hypothetical protein